MADPGKYLRIPMHQGLLESQESSKVPIGFMTELVNWVPEQTGGLRARGKWLKGSEAGLPATRQNRGIGTFNRFTDPAIVQVSAPLVTGVNTNAAAISLQLTWGTPTTLGNTLLTFITVATVTNSVIANAWSITPTAPWSTRLALQTTAGIHEFVGVLECANAAVQSGAQTVATTFRQTGLFGVSVIAWMVEVAGISTFESSSVASTTGTSAAGVLATTTQPSEIVFAIDSAKKAQPVGAFTLSTASTGYGEQTESTQNRVDSTAGTATHSAAFYVNKMRAIGTAPITVDSTLSVGHTVALLSYKGWNTAATVTDASRQLLTANYTGTASDIYAVDRDTLNTATFAVVDASRPSSGEPIAFTNGMGAAHYTASSFPGIRRWDGVTASTIASSPIGARCIAITHDRMWGGGIPAYPARLFYTDLLDPFDWTSSGAGFWDIGTDDGEFVEDITPFNDGLLIGKETSLWFLSGSTTSDFARHQLPSGGAAPGRSLLTTPFGAVIAGTDQVWLYDGDTVTRLGNAIEVSYGPTGYVTTSYQDGSIYIADPLAERVYVFNLGGPVGTWRVEECEDTIGTLYNVGGRQFMGPYSTTVGSLVNYRDFPAPARGKDYDPLGMSYRMRTGDLWVDGALHPSTPRQLYLQLRQRGGDPADPGLVVTPVFNGVDANDCDVGADNPGTRRVKVQGFPQKHRVGSFGFGITQTLGTGDASVFDIEDAWVEYIQESTL